mmetsp:Transcript_20777/g.32544  ORF Transcript_20777/g.32544 Transcript_20777/m.32544 type:complete len:194 (+) Transcript_20777:631-1212(+)
MQKIATAPNLTRALSVCRILLGFASVGPVIIYPLMKRVTNWPQLVLGLTINWGALVGASSIVGSCPWEYCLPLYLGSVGWTMTYDTIYAHQDKVDDRKVGVKSTALLLGDYTKPALFVWSGAFVTGLGLAGQAAGMGIPYYIGVTGAAMHLTWQIVDVDLSEPKDCMAKFVANRWVGAIYFGGIVVDKLMQLS